MEIKYFIKPSLIRELTVLHDNVEDKLIFPNIKAVQDFKIRPLLGSNLFRKMLTIINDGTIKTDGALSWYRILLEDYLVDSICNYVMAEMPESLNYQMYNKGLSTLKDDKTTQPNIQDLYTLISTFVTRGDGYAKEARKFILQNITRYPEYTAVVDGIAATFPENVGDSCPLYLGDESEQVMDEYSLWKHRRSYSNSKDPFNLFGL